jgi:hypothetical protein
MEAPKAHNRCRHLNREIFCAVLSLLCTAMLMHRKKQTMTVDESKALKKGARVYWQGTVADSGVITETSWDAVTIAWNNGQVARVHHGDMREIGKTPTQPRTV